MSKIKFLADPSTIYDGSFSQIGRNQIRLVLESELPSPEVLLSGLQLVNEHNGYVQTNRNDYKYIYRTYEDNPLMIELCNDGIKYTEPEPVPEPEPYEPTEEELAAIFKQNKNDKISLSKSMLAEYLENNPIHSSAHGIEGVYSVTNEKQTLMMSQYMTYQIEKSVNKDARLTWNETGKSCEEWTEEEFLQLILEIKSYVYPLVSYQQHIEEYIYKCTTQEELDEITIDYSFNKK